VSPSIDKHRAELGGLCRRYRVLSLSLFGSATRDDFDPERSDYDFLVEFEALPPGQYADAYFGLLESLVRLMGRPVDLVVASAIKNPYFRQSVEQTRALLYAA
jgi:predicted nucleotidyltransferase